MTTDIPIDPAILQRRDIEGAGPRLCTDCGYSRHPLGPCPKCGSSSTESGCLTKAEENAALSKSIRDIMATPAKKP